MKRLPFTLSPTFDSHHSRVTLVDEHPEIETRFRGLTRLRQPATKDWADSFLAAFATVGLLTLVTFDR